MPDKIRGRKKVVSAMKPLKLTNLVVTQAGPDEKAHAIITWRTGPHDQYRSGKVGAILRFEAEASGSEIRSLIEFGVYSPQFKQQVIDFLKNEPCIFWNEWLPDIKAVSFDTVAVELHHLNAGHVFLPDTKATKSPTQSIAFT